MRFTPSTIDTDMYYQQNTKEGRTDYYELLLVYVDNILACSHDAKAVMSGIATKFEIKNDEIAEKNLYLSGNVETFHFQKGKHAWSITSNY